MQDNRVYVVAASPYNEDFIGPYFATTGEEIEAIIADYLENLYYGNFGKQEITVDMEKGEAVAIGEDGCSSTYYIRQFRRIPFHVVLKFTG